MTSSDLFRWARWRPTLSPLGLNLLVTGWILLALNAGFWSRLAATFHGDPLRIGLFGLGVAGLTMLVLELFGPGRLQRPVAAGLIIIAAAASYYERSFGVLIDREMVRNVFETTVTESRHLITPDMILIFGLTGLAPAALVFWPRIRRRRALHQLWRWPLGAGLSLAVVLGVLLGDYKAFSAVLRERHDLMGSYQPGASLAAALRYGREQWKTADPVARPIATDAAPGRRLAAQDKPVLLVLYVGETARAQNFGLAGYARNTTPRLAAQAGVLGFGDVTACGTSTAVSVPCMFSALPQARYSRDAALSQENLLDVLARAGLQVRWVDNNTGDQKVASRTGWARVDATLDPAACTGECTDEIFLPVIRQTLDSIRSDTVLVLHMIGNHGPAYHLRYPAERALFQPDCRTVQFSDCTTAEIVNAYDNAILETDYVLARSIEMLQASDRAQGALIYVSDHGESLGENGLYLHAAPRFMAPQEQTVVPMVWWMADGFRQTMGLDDSCLRRRAAQPASHDNLFHSVLGLLDISTRARDPALDLTEGCRAKEAS